MRTDLRADHRAPAAARRVVAATLGELVDGATEGRLRPRPEDVMLVVSELVTNSVRAGATSITLELTADDDVLALSVSDDAPGWPTVREPAWGEVGGRGLTIVSMIADEWTTTTLDPGKRVTACWHLLGAGPMR